MARGRILSIPANKTLQRLHPTSPCSGVARFRVEPTGEKLIGLSLKLLRAITASKSEVQKARGE